MAKKTIYDVAKEAGVSITTVSRVINGSANVKESTRKRVEAACKDYYPVAAAQQLQSKRTMTIGVLINHSPEYFFLNEIYSNVLLGISIVAKQNGYRLLLDISDDDSSAKELFSERYVDGFVLMGTKRGNELIYQMKQENVPFVLIGNIYGDLSDVPHVDIDDRKAAYDVTSYLIRLGHKRIGIITGSQEYASCSDRLDGFRLAMDSAGLPVDDGWVQICGDITEQKSEQLAKNLFYQIPRVTAVVTFNDSVAMALYKSAKDCGLLIPQDLSVISFDDTSVASYMAPPLTSVWQPSVEKGKVAATMLIQLFGDGIRTIKSETLQSIIMYRNSCDSPPQETD